MKKLISPIGNLNQTRFLSLVFVLFSLSFLFITVSGQKTVKFDNFILDFLRQFINPTLTIICKIFYFIGDEYFAATIVIINLILLYRQGYKQEAKYLGVSTLGIIIIIDRILKPLFARRRPLERLIGKITGYSFPSGHASGNLVLYLYLAYLLAERFPKFARYIYSITVIFLIFMGFSVMYLRVHWPTDILASYGVGYIWLTFCLTLLESSRKTDSR